MRYESRQELANKADQYGYGVYGLLRSGITMADMPDADSDLTEAWCHLDDAYEAFSVAIKEVQRLLPRPEAWQPLSRHRRTEASH
jgi:hypothetical protein